MENLLKEMMLKSEQLASHSNMEWDFLRQLGLKRETSFLDQHIQRLKNGWEKLMKNPFPQIDFQIIIEEIINKNKFKDRICAVKIIAGKGERDLPPYDDIFFGFS